MICWRFFIKFWRL